MHDSSFTDHDSSEDFLMKFPVFCIVFLPFLGDHQILFHQVPSKTRFWWLFSNLISWKFSHWEERTANIETAQKSLVFAHAQKKRKHQRRRKWNSFLKCMHWNILTWFFVSYKTKCKEVAKVINFLLNPAERRKMGTQGKLRIYCTCRFVANFFRWIFTAFRRRFIFAQLRIGYAWTETREGIEEG